MTRSPLTRRAVLRAIAAGAVAAPVLTACTTEDGPPAPDPLAALAARARADAALATAVAAAAPALAAPAGEVARVRGEHAAVLQAEVDRERPPSSTAPSSTPAAAPPAAPADPAAAKAALVDGLTAAEKEAGGVVAAVPRHRAGMVASVGAACASLREVLA